MPDTKARELAYFGDVDALRLLAGSEKNLSALEKNTKAQADALFEEAVRGEAWSVFSLLAEYGWPTQYPNLESWSYSLTPAAVSELAKRVPTFQQTIGPGLLLYTLRQSNLKLSQSLTDSGVKLSGGERALATAMFKRNYPMIKWLLDQGADPYLPARDNAVELGRKLKSSDLLAALDRKGALANEIAQLRKEFAPPPENLGLVGTWARRKDGFGSLVIVLYGDGTALLAGDLGPRPVLWHANQRTVDLIQMSPEIPQPAANLSLAREADELVLVDPKSNARISLRQESKGFQSSTLSEPRNRPMRLRVQSCTVDNEGLLWIGINGRHGCVPLDQLVEAAKLSTYGSEANSKNILDWEAFEAGPIPPNVSSRGAHAQVDDRTASPDYSPQWKELYLDHEQPAALVPGSTFTLFRGIPSPNPLRLDEVATPEYPHVFALLAEKPFPHGKRWLLIYLRKGRLTHSGP